MSAWEAVQALKRRMSESIIGQEQIVDGLIIGLLANGNVLMEGVPGLAKTRAVKSLAWNIQAKFSRIQFTPDLLPSDITGAEVLHAESGNPQFRFEPGPIFANIVLADEINRAPAKVQAALLEAMEERQVTVAGASHRMPDLFVVMATQNPIEQEGTYPLPEAQLDRFLMHLYVDYPNEQTEGEIIQLVRAEEQFAMQQAERSGDLSRHLNNDETAIQQQSIFDARVEISRISVSPIMQRYLVDLIFASRYPERYSTDLADWIHLGSSPRGGLALDRCARAHAWLQGRDQVLPEDIRAMVKGCLRHRLLLSYQANAQGVSANLVLDELLARVALA